MKVKIISLSSLILESENDADEAIIDSWQNRRDKIGKLEFQINLYRKATGTVFKVPTCIRLTVIQGEE